MLVDAKLVSGLGLALGLESEGLGLEELGVEGDAEAGPGIVLEVGAFAEALTLGVTETESTFPTV